MKPILCNTQVVQNILAGRQSQDRRPIKGLDGEWIYSGPNDKGNHLFVPAEWQLKSEGVNNCTVIKKSKYQPGDILYVRETFCETTFIQCARTNDWDYKIIDGQRDDNGVLGNYAKCVMYRTHELSCPVGKWRPSIHMPKWAARIFLKVTKVRVERIQNISTADCTAEGVIVRNIGETPYRAFKAIWESIYSGSWEKNDWVFVYDFERCEKP